MEPLSLSSLKKFIGFLKKKKKNKTVVHSVILSNASDFCCAVITGGLEVCLRSQKRKARKQADISFTQDPLMAGHLTSGTNVIYLVRIYLEESKGKLHLIL